MPWFGGVLEDWVPTSSSYAPTLSGDPELKSMIRDAQGSGCFKPWLGQFASARPEFSSGTGKDFESRRSETDPPSTPQIHSGIKKFISPLNLQKSGSLESLATSFQKLYLVLDSH